MSEALDFIPSPAKENNKASRKEQKSLVRFGCSLWAVLGVDSCQKGAKD
jgi:hypothetical protein